MSSKTTGERVPSDTDWCAVDRSNKGDVAINADDTPDPFLAARLSSALDEYVQESRDRGIPPYEVWMSPEWIKIYRQNVQELADT